MELNETEDALFIMNTTSVRDVRTSSKQKAAEAVEVWREEVSKEMQREGEKKTS